MKDKLYALVNLKTGNCIAILCNIDDAIQMQIFYQDRRKGGDFEIFEHTRSAVHLLVDRVWQIQEPEMIEIVANSAA